MPQFGYIPMSSSNAACRKALLFRGRAMLRLGRRTEDSPDMKWCMLQRVCKMLACLYVGGRRWSLSLSFSGQISD